jgi:hypothetical protein
MRSPTYKVRLFIVVPPSGIGSDEASFHRTENGAGAVLRANMGRGFWVHEVAVPVVGPAAEGVKPSHVTYDGFSTFNTRWPSGIVAHDGSFECPIGRTAVVRD